MDRVEAMQVLTNELSKFRERRYEDLVTMVDAPKRTTEVVAPSGSRYFVDVLIHWDGVTGGNVRVTGTIDDGRMRAFVPLTDDFIKASDGSFIGENS